MSTATRPADSAARHDGAAGLPRRPPAPRHRRHVDAHARAGRRRRTGVPARAVHDALVDRRRRGADLDQRRPDPSGPLVHTVRAVGAVTRAICAARPGAVLGVRGPFGTAWPVEAAEGADLVVVAGGIGLAPLRPVAVPRAATPRGASGASSLLYGSRTPADLLYPARARALARAAASRSRHGRQRAESGWHGARRRRHEAHRRAPTSIPDRRSRWCAGPRS